MDITHIALFGHLISLVIGFGAVIVIDFAGFLYLIKSKKGFTLEKVIHLTDLTQPLIWLGWVGLVITGFVMKSQHPGYDELTKFKLFLVATLGVNGFYLNYLKLTFKKLGGDLNLSQKKRIFAASLISQIGWWGSIIIGFAHAHFSHRILWPESVLPYILGLGIFYVLLVLAVERFKKDRL